jgi:hypothetical protein
MDTIKLKFTERGSKISMPELPKKPITEEQMKASFKRIYGKEPTVEEFMQYKLFNQGKA